MDDCLKKSHQPIDSRSRQSTLELLCGQRAGQKIDGRCGQLNCGAVDHIAHQVDRRDASACFHVNGSLLASPGDRQSPSLDLENIDAAVCRLRSRVDRLKIGVHQLREGGNGREHLARRTAILEEHTSRTRSVDRPAGARVQEQLA